ncbi:MAG TPA: DUF1844 domain-containing protein [Chthonomonas sp.]|jgi:hypothetical protein|uniref:DUF1844 domain-containing protein n=1 Tax=Chthonomonas sp. TaxID=2282153 RepID=UPI002B4AD369|nr:DUF1844 domain-containing protein [Chthonomonas sp.]HLH80503.1 DUF1844 domain-containing protein [Chthonomonas sp.]
MEDQAPEFRVIDRRASAAAGREEESSSAEASPSQPTTDTSSSKSDEGMPSPEILLPLVALQMEVKQLAMALVGVFDAHAWRALGLHANPKTGQTEENLPAAQLAIDCMQFLLSKMEGDLPEQELRELRRRLTDLRLNYAARAK